MPDTGCPGTRAHLVCANDQARSWMLQRGGVAVMCDPGRTVTWEQFLQNYPPFSIALDGFCAGPTRLDIDGPRLNLNHHEGPNQGPTLLSFAVNATCAQALNLVRDNCLFDTFQRQAAPFVHIFTNDCDQDVALATFVLLHPESVGRPRLCELVHLEDRLDTTAGLMVANSEERQLLTVVSWIYEPYAVTRLAGTLDRAGSYEQLEIIAQVHRRIRAYLYGKEERAKVDTRYDLLGQGRGDWLLVREVGIFARLGMAEQGVRAYVILKAQHGDRYVYSLGIRSPLVRFPLLKIFAACNQAEGIGPDEIDRWGGSVNRGGSPRARGSRLTPAELTTIIDRCLE